MLQVGRLRVRILKRSLDFLIDLIFSTGAEIATGYGLDDRDVGIRVLIGSRIFSFPRRPDRLWDPPSPGSSFPGGEATEA
jgi:hypothetical protein